MEGVRQMALRAGTWGRRGSRFALDLVFPPLCIACGARVGEPHALCSACWADMTFVDGAQCARCGIPFDVDPGDETVCAGCLAKPHAFEAARSLFVYDDVSKALILSFKHADRLDYAPALARWLERAGRPMLEGIDLIVPVPLHRWRLWRRRYNQAAILADRVARLSGVPCDPLALVRRRPTPSQGAMASAKARRRNVLGAFAIPPARAAAIKDRSVLLIDDVFTTGATLDACARALKRGGARTVRALTLARVVRPLVGAI